MKGTLHSTRFKWSHLKSQLKIPIIIILLFLSYSQVYSQFTNSGIDLEPVTYSKCQWGDYDNDGDLDILLLGWSTKILRNNGNNTFTNINVPFYSDFYAYATTWIDYDNDADLDVFHGSRLYKNTGNSIFREIIIEDLNEFNLTTSANYNSTCVADYDNDGDKDLLLDGQEVIYLLNNKEGKFILIDQYLRTVEKLGSYNINSVLMDVDNDGYNDIMSSKIYMNNKQNLYIEDPTFNLGSSQYNLTMGDYDDNGTMDALFLGYPSPLMMKNSAGSFSSVNFASINTGNFASFGDINKDGKQDFIIDGKLIYTSNGAGDFTLSIADHSHTAVGSSLGDYDNDGDLDLLISGSYFAAIYNNNVTVSNSLPTIPANLNHIINGNSVDFTWTRSADAESPAEGLTYNFGLINTSINDTIKSPDANLITGKLLMPVPGNMQANNFFKIKGLRPGNYKWSVQAVDNRFKGSSFAAFKTFTITASNTVAPNGSQVLKPAEDGSVLTVAESVAVSSRQWFYSLYPGGPYIHQITGQTATTYKPKFLDEGRYYVICKSFVGTTTLYSNEVMIEILPFTESVITSIPDYYYGIIKPGDSDNDGDLDLLITGDLGTNIYINTNNTLSPINITTGLYYSDAAWFDLNKDNKLDFIISGSTTASLTSSKLTRIFINQGNNSFTELTHNICGLVSGSVEVGDYDHDGDADVLISGKDVDPVTKLYRNDNGSFTELELPLSQVCDGFARFLDYDNDDDLDVLISGTDNSGNSFTVLYKNEGSDTFNKISYSFTPFNNSNVDFGDYDNDNDVDILLSGNTQNGNEPTIYKNIGNDQFIKKTIINMHGYNVVKWLDLNNDGLLDIFLVGDEWQGYTEYSKIHRFYKNYGNDVFKEIVYKKSWVNQSQLIGLGDLDNDSDVDFLQVSINPNTYERTISAFYNNSYLTKSLPSVPQNLKSVRRGKDIILSWNKPVNPSEKGASYDLMLGNSTGSININSPLSNINSGYRSVPRSGYITDTSYKMLIPSKGTYYWKIQSVNNSLKGSAFSTEASFVISDYFVEIPNPLMQVRYDVDSDWGDYDNDGDQDLLFCGNYWQSPEWKYFTYVYQNNGNGTFNVTPVFDPGYHSSELKWIDLDNDNDLDIAGCMGTSINNYNSFKIFENKGNNIFTEIYETSNSQPDFSYGDYNNDGRTDILLSGIILFNQGDFSFLKQSTPISFKKTGYSLYDFDNDGQKDILTLDDSLRIHFISGGEIKKVTPKIPDFSAEYSDFEAGDLDNDGDLDLIITGGDIDNVKLTSVLRNDGLMKFTEVETFVRGTTYGSVNLGDFDNDGDLDILLSGSSFSVVSKIYENKGNFNFEELDYTIAGVWQGRNGIADIDEDGDLDLLIAGTGETYAANSKILRNDLNVPGQMIQSPSDLTSSKAGFGILLSWKDEHNTGTSYNVRIGSASGTCNIVSPMSDVGSGKRKVTRMGNAGKNLKFKLDNLPVGTYYWSVQAVNNAYKGSSWAPEQSFTITVVNADFVSDVACLGTPTCFTDLTLVSGENIVSRKWDFGDGTFSPINNPCHQYTSAGNFEVKLVVRTANHSDSISKIVVVKSVPGADFTFNTACIGTPTTFTNTSLSNGLTIDKWSWSFGDLQISDIQQPPPHGYINAGDYNVKLKVSATNGCADSVTNVVTVGSYPISAVTSSGLLTFCKGDSVTLSVPFNSAYTYSWKIAGTNLTGASESSYKPKSTGNYTVEIVNPRGNCVSTSPVVNVVALDAPAAPLISADGNLVFCQGDSTILNVTNITGNSYNWKLNGGAIGLDKSSFSAKASGEYSLVVSNASGCNANSVNKITVTVNPKPNLPVISTSGITTFCQGNSVDLSVPAVAGHLYSWKNENGVITGITTNSYTASASGSYQVDISNSYGCAVATSPVSVMVKPSPVKPVLAETNYSKGNCPGEEPVRLSASQATSGYRYQWYKNGLPQQYDTLSYIEFFESGNYKLAADLEGCIAESDISTIDFPEGLPKPFIYAQGPTFWYLACSNTEASRYRWYFNGKAIDGADKYFYLANYKLGNYQVSIANKDGCYTRSDIITIPPGYTGVDDVEPFEGIKIYPNPSSGLFTLEMDNNIKGKLSLEIISPDGKKIRNSEMGKTGEHLLYQMDLTGRPEGMYIINMILNKYRTTRKILIE